MTGYIILAVVVVIAIYAISLYNRLVTRRNEVKGSWRQIDVQLKRRYDLIPNLVETVKDSMAYEQETLTMVIEARNKAVSAQTPADTIKADSQVTAAMGKLFAVMEAYPNLKAVDNVASLMGELSTTENQIAFTRQNYNDVVMSFNTAIQVFPANIVAGMFGFAIEPYFKVEEEAVREAPKVDLR
ncbi:MAG: LemA family protein [Pseudomonadota bacterium]|nr:LemA family protein [Pseudomonadota bacterium]